MPRPLPQILAHIRAVAGNPSINTTLIQTEDLLALCDEVDAAEQLRAALRGLVDVLPEIEKHMNGIVGIAAVHGVAYKGPTWRAELAKARYALSNEQNENGDG